jgi:hypothetical protein
MEQSRVFLAARYLPNENPKNDFVRICGDAHSLSCALDGASGHPLEDE